MRRLVRRLRPREAFASGKGDLLYQLDRNLLDAVSRQHDEHELAHCRPATIPAS